MTPNNQLNGLLTDMSALALQLRKQAEQRVALSERSVKQQVTSAEY
ncbi:MAG: hypothetical protein ACJAYE_003737 [Candidatus Azotimanducaceae bacterium]